jgi:hypothetical protein
MANSEREYSLSPTTAQEQVDQNHAAVLRDLSEWFAKSNSPQQQSADPDADTPNQNAYHLANQEATENNPPSQYAIGPPQQPPQYVAVTNAFQQQILPCPTANGGLRQPIASSTADDTHIAQAAQGLHAPAAVASDRPQKRKNGGDESGSPPSKQ